MIIKKIDYDIQGIATDEECVALQHELTVMMIECGEVRRRLKAARHKALMKKVN